MSLPLDVNTCVTLLSIGMIIALIYRYMRDTYSTLERLGIPGPKPVWVFGNVLEFKGKNVLNVFEEWKQTYGKIYGFYEGLRAGIVINDVEFAQDILNRYFEKFSIRTSYRPFIYYPDNLRLIEIDGGHWKNQRVVINKMLNSPNTLTMVVAKMCTTAKTLIQQLSDELKVAPEGFDITRIIEQYVCEGLMRIVLNMDEENLTKYRQTVYNYQVQCNWSASAENEVGGLARLFPWLTPILKLADKRNKEAHDTVVNILRDYIKNSSLHQDDNECQEDPDSLLTFLLSSKVHCRNINCRPSQRELSSDETIAHLLSLLDEVYPTTVAMIEFILYELACHQECQEKLYEEIQNIPNLVDGLAYDNMKNMDYFDMIFNETYRHHPIAPGLSRVCTESCTIRGVPFQKGMVVRVMTSPMYNDAKLFPRPEEFIPERFSEQNRHSIHQYSFLPFGQGPRMCPGQKLAVTKVKVAVINIIKNFSLSTSKNTEIPLKKALRPSLTPANGVCLQLTKRCP